MSFLKKVKMSPYICSYVKRFPSSSGPDIGPGGRYHAQLCRVVHKKRPKIFYHIFFEVDMGIQQAYHPKMLRNKVVCHKQDYKPKYF